MLVDITLVIRAWLHRELDEEVRRSQWRKAIMPEWQILSNALRSGDTLVPLMANYFSSRDLHDRVVAMCQDLRLGHMQTEQVLSNLGWEPA